MNLFKQSLLHRFPCRFEAALAIGTFSFAIPVTAAEEPLFAVAVAAAAVLAAGTFCRFRDAAVVLTGAVLAFAGYEFQNNRVFHPSSYRWRLPDRDCGAEMVLRIADSRVTSVPEIPPPGLLRAEAEMLALTGEEEQRVSGTIFLRPPRDCPIRFRYGDRFRAFGILELPRSSDAVIREGERLRPFGGGYSFADYLAGRGVSRVFRADLLEPETAAPGWFGAVLNLRDWLLGRTLNSMENEHSRRMVAALFFGVTGGIDRATRADLIESGTIHLFSVSGLHVAALAALLFLVLSPFPLRLRCRLIPFLLLFYVVSTGGNAPAMRAWFMISLCCLLRSFLAWTLPINTLLLAAAVLVIGNPALVNDIGFQYSFLITAVLLLLSQRFREESELESGMARLMPSGDRFRAERRSRRWRELFFALTGCFAAFLGGAGISLASQGRLIPVSIVANLLLLPVTALLFPVLFFKLAAGSLFLWADRLGGALLDCAFGAVGAITRVTADFSGRWAAVRPEVGELVLFYVALFVALGARRRGIRLSAAAVVVVILFSWPLRVAFEPPAVLIASGGSTEFPLIAIVEPARELATVVNPSGYDGVRAASAFLRERGATRITALAVSATRKPVLSGLPELFRSFPVDRLILPEPDRYSRAFLASLEETAPELPCYTPESGGDYGSLELFQINSGFEVAYFNRGSKFNIRVRLSRTDGGWRWTLRRPGEPSRSGHIVYGSVPEVSIHEFVR